MASVFASLDLRRLAIGESQGVDGASRAGKIVFLRTGFNCGRFAVE